MNFTGGLAQGISSAWDHTSEEVFPGRVSDVCLWGGTKHSSSVKRSISKHAETCRTFGMLGYSLHPIQMERKIVCLQLEIDTE